MAKDLNYQSAPLWVENTNQNELKTNFLGGKINGRIFIRF